MSYIPLRVKKSSIWLTCLNRYLSLKISKLLLSSRLPASALLQGPMAAKNQTTLAEVNTDKFTTKGIKNITRKFREEAIGHRPDTATNETKIIRIMLDSQEIRHKSTNKEEVVKIINAALIIRTLIKRAEKVIKITFRL